MTQDERALATVEVIQEIRPIENADAIEVARVRNWDVVVRKGEFFVGDKVVYFEIDSFLPLDDSRFLFLAPRGARKNQEGVEGHVLKTAKLRGVYSQGLILPTAGFPSAGDQKPGTDITATIAGLEKWDPPIPTELAGSARGSFPSQFRKTDEERIQNFASIPLTDDPNWVATEKIDGSSMTVWVDGDDQGVASRNWDIEDTKFNSMWNLARELELHDLIRGSFEGKSVAVQGEIFGPGIQGNPLDVKKVQFRAFTLQVGGSELPRSLWPEWLLKLSVPVHPLSYPQTVDEALAQVDNLKSLINPQKAVEGVVWRNTEGAALSTGARASWKAISSRYLMKHDR